MEFSLEEILVLLKKRFILIVICTFVGLCISCITSRYIIKPSYTASVQMYVDPKDSSLANLNELNYAQKVVETYVNFLQTKIFYKQVMEESKLSYTLEELREMTTIQAIGDTEIFEINVTSFNPKDSLALVEAMTKVAPRLIKDIKDTVEINVVDPAILPKSPSSPNVLLNTMVGGIVGLTLSIIALLLWEMMNINVKNQEELDTRYQIPVLGVIPNFDENVKSKNALSYIKASLEKRKIIKRKMIKKTVKSIDNDTKFIVVEAYKSLRTNLRFTLPMNRCKKIIISSPVPEDGKSTTLTNIGITIAQTNARILMIDCDLRKGTLHRIFELENRVGVSDVLSGMVDLGDAIQNTSYENLQVITMGTIPPNPTELLASVQMEELIEKVDKEYDYILIDTPPVNVVSDIMSIIKLADGVLIVVREGETSHLNISNALMKYRFAEANILGFVLNGVIMNQGEKSEYYYYDYKDKND
jgi:polysaccharide biosynthesis transport protein